MKRRKRKRERTGKLGGKLGDGDVPVVDVDAVGGERGLLYALVVHEVVGEGGLARGLLAHEHQLHPVAALGALVQIPQVGEDAAGHVAQRLRRQEAVEEVALELQLLQLRHAAHLA